MSRAPFTFYEFFAGGGMARAGLGEGWRCLFANDFDPMKARTYRENWGSNDLKVGDVWSLKVADIPGRADLAWASSPCQDFSLAGARAGLGGGRSSAFFGFWRLIEGLKAAGRPPRTIVIENVVGLLTSHNGADFETLCKALTGQGYNIGAVEIDAARFVPQSRPRVFFIATLCKIPPALTQVEPTPPFHSKRVVWAFDQLSPAIQAKWVWWHLRFPPARNERLDAILEPDDCVRWLSDTKRELLLSRLNERHRDKLDRAKARNERTIGTVFRRMRTENGVKVQRSEIRFDGWAGCLRTPGGGSSKQFVVVVDGMSVRIRTLTSRESARLMGLPDTYVLPTRTTASLHVTGDGVVVPVVDFIRSNIIEMLPVAEGVDNESEKGRRSRARAI
jgi:DNA (cytosine-5)-methyltransferase 1